MSNKIIRALWGDLKGNELKKFMLLALAFFFLIGSYWPLKTLKDSIFINLVGPEYIPNVKILSLFFFFPLVLLYSKLLDIFSKEKMIYLLIGVYGLIGLVFVFYFYHPTIGLSNTVVSKYRLLGWLFFLYVESYISLMVSLYWSFVNDITPPDSAKKGYGLIIFGAQLGGFLFILFANRLSAQTGLYAQRAPLIALISIIMFLVIGIITYAIQKLVHAEHLTGFEEKLNRPQEEEKKESVGFFEGLRVIMTHPYVAGIFGIIFFHEVISAIMGYQMLLLAKSAYPGAGALNKFLFDYSLATQGIACVFGLIGTSFFQRRFGIKFCIITYPLLLGLFVVFYMFHPTIQSIFYVMLITKGINYAFNTPAKEVLYTPTSKNIKYKSKAWADMFGFRFGKASGSLINKAIGPLIQVTGTIVLVILGIWIVLANTLGNRFKRAVDRKELIE